MSQDLSTICALFKKFYGAHYRKLNRGHNGGRAWGLTHGEGWLGLGPRGSGPRGGPRGGLRGWHGGAGGSTETYPRGFSSVALHGH